VKRETTLNRYRHWLWSAIWVPTKLGLHSPFTQCKRASSGWNDK